MDAPRTSLRYLVVGTGRSGTVYAAKLLTAAGIPCSHERVFAGGTAVDAARILAGGGANSACSTHCGLGFDGRPAAESSYMAVPFLRDPWLSQCSLIHIVRDPLKVISSFLNNLLFFREVRPEFRQLPEQFLYDHLPHLEALPDPVSRACFYYLRWNQMIEEAAGWRSYLAYPVERGPRAVLEFLGIAPDAIELPDSECNAYSGWPSHMRVASDQPAVSEQEILSCFLWKEVATLAAKYGYHHEVPSRPTVAIRQADPAANRPHHFPVVPRLVEEGCQGFNIIQYLDTYYAIHQDVGPLDLINLSAADRDRLTASGRFQEAESLRELKMLVRAAAAELRLAERRAYLMEAYNRERRLLDAIDRAQADFWEMQDKLREAYARLMKVRPWYRKAGAWVKRRCRRLGSASVEQEFLLDGNEIAQMDECPSGDHSKRLAHQPTVANRSRE